MLLILSAPDDPITHLLAARWAHHASQIVTGDSLACAGWDYVPGRATQARVALPHACVDASAITAVLTRISHVFPEHLSQIAEEDCDYVAQEMTAFLTAWLDELPCPVLNRPRPGNLSGPSWPQARWRQLAASLGHHVSRARLDAPAAHPLGFPAHAQVWPTAVVAGSAVFGSVAPPLRMAALALARRAGVALLGVFFDAHGADAGLVGVTTTPDVHEPEVTDAVLALLLARAP